MRKKTRQFALLGALSMMAVPGFCEGIFQWHSTNIQLLRGHDYELGESHRSIVTLEHAHGWTYGDSYFFVDFLLPDGGKKTSYTEFSPRLSFSKLTGQDLSFGIIKDVLISTTIEKPEHHSERYLYGGAIDLDLPGFRFFKTNIYIRDNPDLKGNTWQLTLAWNRPFELSHTSFLLEGFADFSGGEGKGQSSNQLIVPRLLADIGHLSGLAKGTLWGGIEYSYWRNKFGVNGVTEKAPQLQLKWVF